MATKIIQASVVALLALAAPVAISAQEKAPAEKTPAAQPQQELQTWVVEIQQIQAKLAEIQETALKDPKLHASQEALGAEVKAAMEKLDPSLAATPERIRALEEEAAKAQQSGDQAKLQQLATEAQGIQARFMEAQAKVLEQPELATRLDAFQTDLEKKMLEVNSETPALIERYKELGTKIQGAMSAAPSR